MPRARTTQRRMNQQVYIANESFVTNVDGVDRSYHQGRTRVYEDDPILDRLPHLFDLLEDNDTNQQ